MRDLYRTDRHDTPTIFAFFIIFLYFIYLSIILNFNPLLSNSHQINYNNYLKNFYIKCYNPIEKELPNTLSKINTYYKFLNKILTKEKIYDII